MMYYSNNSNQLNDGLVHMNGWSQVVPISMPWASDTTTTTTATVAATTPLPPHLMATNTPTNTLPLNYHQNVMQFTANTQIPMANPALHPSLLTSYNTSSTIASSPLMTYTTITPTVPYNTVPTVTIDSSPDVLCPDPCTSQTATRWELLNGLLVSADSQRSSHQHLKRRNESSDDDDQEDDGIARPPLKQYISEEKVSAIFDRLHITNSINQNNNNNNVVLNDKCDTDQDFEDASASADGIAHKSPIIFADELQSAIKSKTMTERLIQNEMDKHSKAVVIWRPNNPLFSIGSNQKSTADDDNDDDSDIMARNGANCVQKTQNHINDSFIDDSDIDFSHLKDEEFVDYDDNDMEEI